MMLPNNDVQYLTGEQLTIEGFPRVQFKETYTTDRPSLGSGTDDGYSLFGPSDGYLHEWPNFMADVRNTTYGTRPEPTTYLDVRLANQQSSGSLHSEQLMCGEKKGIKARFSQNVLHVMSAVAAQTNVPIVFGDFRASKHDTGEDIAVSWPKIPDYTAMTRGPADPSIKGGHEIRIVGEAKADFANKIVTDFEYRPGSNGMDDNEFQKRRWVGQSYIHMRGLGLKYAFLTTHTYTVFLKLEEDKLGFARLYYSPPISAETFSTESTVSVREAIWSLMAKAATPDEWRLQAPRTHGASARALGVADSTGSCRVYPSACSTTCTRDEAVHFFEALFKEI